MNTVIFTSILLLCVGNISADFDAEFDHQSTTSSPPAKIFLSSHTVNLLNRQINAEQSAAYSYQFLSSHFKNQGRHKLADQFKEWAEEEYQHANELADYMLLRRGNLVYHRINEPRFSESQLTVDGALQFVLSKEQEVYDSILNIHRMCNDPSMEDFLVKFLDEGIESVRKAFDLLQEYNRIR